MRFLHTADWHLGRRFHQASLQEDQHYALTQIIDYARDYAVDAVVVAGDIYDRAVPPRWAVELLDHVLDVLCNQLSIPVILIPGNHDSAERLGFGARHLQRAGLHIVSRLEDSIRPVVIGGAGERVNFYCVPFSEPVQVSELAGHRLQDHQTAHAWIVEQITSLMSAGDVNVLVSHCFVAGGSESDSERQLSVGGADSVAVAPMLNFNYVALGHLHRPQQRSAEHIRYSGSLLQYSFSEAGQGKVVLLVDVCAGQCAIEQLPLPPLREVRVLEGGLDDLLSAGSAAVDADDYLLVRLLDKGALLNAMGRLREVYPNVLHLERPGLLGDSQPVLAGNRLLTRDELEMFEDFFQQVTGDALNQQEKAVITATLENLRQSSGPST